MMEQILKKIVKIAKIETRECEKYNFYKNDKVWNSGGMSIASISAIEDPEPVSLSLYESTRAN